MHSAPCADFANDNHALNATEREAIGLALSLPDARDLRTALRKVLAAIQPQGRPRGQLSTPVRLVMAASPARITQVCITQEATGS